MARIRTIKPEFPQSESMGRVSREARLCYVLLWTLADDAGRLRGNSRMLASLLYPYDDDANKRIDKWLEELHKECCITRYEVGGNRYIQINEWLTHQKIDKPSPSKIPEPPEDSRGFAKHREDSAAEGKGRDQGEDQGEEKDSDEPQSVSPPVASIPLVDGTSYDITQAQIDEWLLTYPAVDVVQQVREMRQWSLANAPKRKTRKGVLNFVTTWLGREQDKGGSRARASPPAETAYQRSMRERVEQFAPGIAAKPPGTQQPLTEVFDVAAKLLT